MCWDANVFGYQKYELIQRVEGKKEQMSDLEGKTIIITGVGRPRGIGRASALRFAREGANLVLADLGSDGVRPGEIEGVSPDLEAVVEEVRGVGAQVLAVPTDVSVEADVENLVAKATERFGRLDGMVANAAILAARGDPLEVEYDAYMRVLSVNLAGVFLSARVAAREMKRQCRSGSIVTVGSRASRRGAADTTAYCSAKFGVIGLTQSLAMAGDGIRVNCVCPGAVDTQMYVGVTNDLADKEDVDIETARNKLGAAIPLGRLTTADDVAKAIVWFARDEASHVTGQSLNVNGGSWMN